MSYDGKCGSCANFVDDHGNPFDPRWSYPTKGYCEWYKTYYYPDESCGPHYRPRGYVTTMVCSRLGLGKENEVYKTIIGFQKNTMEKDPKYEATLREYDVIGPQISKCLETESMGVINMIYSNFLVPVATLIKENEEESAVYRYRGLLDLLKAHYKISSKTSDFKQTTTKGKMKVLSVKKNI